MCAVAAKRPYYGYLRLWNPRRYAEISCSTVGTYENNSCVGQVWRIRSQPLDPSMDYAYYDDNMIAEGFIQVEPPFVSHSRGLVIMTVLVGTDPPRAGIESPLPLFRLIRNEVRRSCPLRMPGKEHDRGYAGVVASPGADDWYKRGGALAVI